MKGTRKRLLSWLLAIAMIVGTLQTNVVTAYAAVGGDNRVDLSSYITKELKQGDKTITTTNPPMEITYGSTLTLALNWNIPNNNTAWTNADADTVYYYTLPIACDDIENKVLKDGNGDPCGTYSVSGGVFSFQLYDEFLQSNQKKNNFEGYANLSYTVDKTHGFVNKEYDEPTKLMSDVTVKIVPDKTNWGLKVEKSSEYNTSKMENHEFTIKVTSTGTNNGVKVEDIVGGKMAVVSGKNGFTVKNQSGETVDNTSVEVSGADGNGYGGTYTINLGTMNDGDVYTISYKVNVDPSVLNGSESDTSASISAASWNNEGLKNTAKVYNEDSTDPKGTTDSGLQVSKTWATKSGVDNNGTILWTVTLNADGATADLSGATLKDTVANNHEYIAGSITVDGALANAMSGSSAIDWGKLFTDGITLDAGQNLTGKYTITYQTKPTNVSSLEKTDYNNDFYITPSGGHQLSTGGKVTIGTDWTWITKSCDTDNGSGASGLSEETPVSWTITVNIPDGYDVSEGKTVTDTLPKAWDSGLSNNINMTLVESSVEINGEKATATVSGERFTVNLPIQTGDDGLAAGDQTFKITFDTVISNASDIKADSLSFTNKATFQKDATATYTYKKTKTAPGVNKWSTGENSTGVATWGIQINEADKALINNITDETTLKLVDTIPAGMEYAKGSGYIIDNQYWGGTKTEIEPDIVKNDDGTTTLTFTLSKEQIQAMLTAGGNPLMSYQTKLSNIGSLEDGKSYTYTNKAHWVYNDNIGDDTSASYKFNNTGSVFDKTAELHDGNELSYTVTVNENALTINGGNKYSLTDVMGSGIDYTMGSLKVNGEEWTGKDKATYDYATRTLTIKGLEDATKYVITYSATTNLEPDTTFTAENAGNSISLTGSKKGVLSDSYTLSGKAAAATAGVKVKGKAIKVTKYGDGDQSKLLANATFALYDLGTIEEGTEMKTAPDYSSVTPVKKVTGASGTTMFNELLFDNLYLLMEVSAPAGYARSTEMIYFVFRGTITKTDDHAGSDDLVWPSDAEVYTSTSQTQQFYINNDKSSTTEKEVVISKVSAANSEEIEGARLKIVNMANSNEVASWTSGDDGKDESGSVKTHKVKLEPGTYKLIETTAPDGFEIAESILFKVDAEGKVYLQDESGEWKTEAETTAKVTMTDAVEKTEVEISKQDIAGEEIAGATLKVYSGTDTSVDANKVEEWTSKAGESHKVKVADGTYTLVEEAAPTGYVKAESIQFVVENGKVKVNGSEVDAVVMTDQYSKHNITISKQKIEEGAASELSGATLQIYKADGKTKVGESWTSDEAHTANLEPGDYLLVEESAPSGYAVADPIAFTIGVDGNIADGCTGKVSDNKIVMIDRASEKHGVKIAKVNEDGDLIAGAQLALTDADGNLVDSWTSQTVAKEVQVAGSAEGITYTLTETSAPDGYKVSDPVTFKVTESSGSITVTDEKTPSKVSGPDTNGVYTVTMTDQYAGTLLQISKVDVNGDVLEGAALKLTRLNADGTTDSTFKAQELNLTTKDLWQIRDLKPGTYQLEETSAPTGYQKAATVKFTLAADGTVTITEGAKTTAGKTNATFDADNKVLQLVDDYQNYDVTISKVDATNGKEIEGAELTIKDSDSNVVAKWKSGVDGKNADGSVKTHVVTLQPGTYTLIETMAPDGYKESEESITFTINADGTIQNTNATRNEDGKTYTITMKDERKTTEKDVKISKVDITGDNEVVGATLAVINQQNEVVATWTSTGDVKTISIMPGTYTLRETIAPDGYKKATDITFSVDDKGVVTSTSKNNNGETVSNMVDGVLIMKDDYETYAVSLSKQNIGGELVAGATLELSAENDKDAFGNAFNKKTWITRNDGDQSFIITPGTYTLKETIVPAGSNYKQASDITFTVDKKGNVAIVSGTNCKLDGKKVIMIDEYKTSKVSIKKVDSSSKGVVGATLQLSGTTLSGVNVETKSVNYTWTTEVTGTDPKAKDINLQPGNYVLSEISTPDGYKQATNIAIKIEKDGKLYLNGSNTAEKMTADNLYEIKMVDETKDPDKYTLVVSKQDVGGKEIKGATLTINGTEKVSNPGGGTTEQAIQEIKWVSGEQPTKIELNPGTYTLKETGVPGGYAQAEEIKFTITYTDETQTWKVEVVNNDAGNKAGSFTAGQLVMKDEYQPHDVTISKQDLIGAEVEGATLTIYNNKTGEIAKMIDNGEEKDATWTSGTTAKVVKLKPGEYLLKETNLPSNGHYVQAASILFTVAVDGTVKVGGNTVDQVVMTDDWADKTVYVSKEDIAGAEIDGAKLEITGKTKDGKQITPIGWTSVADQKHTVQLKPGDYTLTETTAPNGYAKAESIKFTITTDYDVKVNRVIPKDETETATNTVTMEDKYAERTIKISKQDIASSQEITGAKLTITQGKTKVAEWVSEAGKTKEISYAWDPSKIYTLTEVVPAAGYSNLSTAITFQVGLDGKVTNLTSGKVDGKDEGVLASDGKTIVVNNKVKPDEPDTPGGGGGDHEDPETPTTEVKLKGSVAIVKTSSKTGLALSGAVYELYTKDGKLVGTYTTNEYGVIQVTGLDLGEYYFVEIQAPEGYIVDSWEQVFTLGKTDTNRNPQIVAVTNAPIEPDDEEGIGADGDSGMMFDGDGGAISATGDNSLMNVYGVAAAMAAAVLALWVVAGRKRHHI